MRDDVMHVLIKRLTDMNDVKTQIEFKDYIDENYKEASYVS